MNNKYEELKNRIDEEIKSIEESKSKLNELIEEVEKAEQEEKCNNKMPFEIGEGYYFISTVGSVVFGTWDNDEIDFWKLSQGQVFKTEQEAEDKLFQLTLEGKAREFRRVNNCDVSKEDLRNMTNCKYYIYYNLDYIYYNLVNGITIGTDSVKIETTKLGYFKSREMANRFIKENEEDLIKYFKIEMGV